MKTFISLKQLLFLNKAKTKKLPLKSIWSLKLRLRS